METAGHRARAMTQEFFEELARTGDRLSDALRLEFIAGTIEEKARPDGNHGRIIQWLTRLCMQTHPQRWLYVDQGLRVETHRKGNARPDGCLAPSGTFAGQSEWASPDGALAAGEVLVHSQPGDRRYDMVVTVTFGKTVTLPEPVGMELDTEPLKAWVD